MKKLLRILFLTAALAAALCISAVAAEDVSAVDGVYNVQGTGATLDFYTATGTQKLTAEQAYVTESSQVNMFKEAVRFDVKTTGGTPNSQYLLLVCNNAETPNANNIVYINQTAADAGGNISFANDNKAYPSTMAEGTYYVYIVGAGKAYDSKKTAAQNAAAIFQTYSAYKLGDVNDDGNITANDAILSLQIAVDMATVTIKNAPVAVTTKMRLSADVNKKDGVTANDALMILKKAVGIDVF